MLAGAAFTVVLGANFSIMGYEDMWSREALAEGPKPAAVKRQRRK